MTLSSRALLNLDSYFKFPWICFRYLLKNRKTKTHCDNVLVIKLFGMGSIVKLAALCDEFNVDKSRVTLLTQSRFKEICLLLGFTQCLFIRLDGFWNLIKDCFEVLYQSKKKRINLIVDFERCSNAVSLFRSMLALRMNCKTVSFDELNKNILLPSDEIFGKDWLPHNRMFTKGITYLQKSNQLKHQLQLLPDASKIIININSSDYLLARRYPRNQFSKIVQLIHEERPDLTYYFTGSANEHEYIDPLIDELADLKIKVFNQAGLWNIEKLIRELSICAVFITNDSGPLHLSALLQTPTVAIWGPTQPQQFGYEDLPNLKNISLALTCSPCFVTPSSKPAEACGGRIDCMKLFPERIAKAVLETLMQGKDVRTISGLSSLFQLLSNGQETDIH